MGNLGEWVDAGPGVRRKILSVGRGVMNMVVEFAEGAVGAEHAHPQEQLTYVLEGEFEFRVDGRTLVVRKGDSLYIPSGATHGVRALSAGVLLDTFAPVREDLLGHC
ncbi:MAG: cupin [Candidatus Reconcilbacillus cellulovorans]|uniref:Cupin n=1 Tax=Candidatus Reconcilbacillus cellulovorans TaxID=1906605 RepID=A0A2A6E4B0_9BACL|nr:MAG: cupin [Candidatus Reconcilbacillus cellulovorans]